MRAVAAGSLETVRVLLRAGASTRPADAQGLAAVDYALQNLKPVSRAAPPATSAFADLGPHEATQRRTILEELRARSALERDVRLDLENPRLYGDAAELAAMTRQRLAQTPAAKRAAGRAASLLKDDIVGRVCLFHASHVELPADDGAHAYCDSNATDVPAAFRDRRQKPKRDCDLHLFSVTTVSTALDVRRMPGVAQRAVLNAARESRTALVYPRAEWRIYLF